ncbi:MAG: DUF1232 domain-containing protein [Chloroflexi bacterium]|nr:DUF1232 domain-containing protein [Chloroflexota bacterium]OJV96994.1 MAG: hypothetical protein BGO39_18425 [Chloroflexi bacterium 54-19]
MQDKSKRPGKLRQWARRLKRDVLALYLSVRDKRVPWYAKLVAGCVVAYALSPIDLIPDFIPVLGLFDDMLLLPLGIALAVRLIPPDILEENRQKASQMATRPISRAGAVAIVVFWLIILLILVAWLAKWF